MKCSALPHLSPYLWIFCLVYIDDIVMFSKSYKEHILHLVFAGSVLWTEKIHRTELNQTVVWSIFRLWLPKFGVILVASCLISKIIQNCSKTS